MSKRSCSIYNDSLKTRYVRETIPAPKTKKNILIHLL